jgi:hypothetical protein
MGKEGVVNNVVFPTGHALFGMTFISTMAPLTCTVAKVSLTELLDELKNNHKYNSTMRLEKGLKMHNKFLSTSRVWRLFK